ncbi:hypothetical protein FSST1_002882 [Fusarium sambucinum]
MDPAILPSLLKKLAATVFILAVTAEQFLLTSPLWPCRVGKPMIPEADDPGSRDVNELESRTLDGSLSSAMRFCRFQFSQDIIAEAQSKCPLFETQRPSRQGQGDKITTLLLRYFIVNLDPNRYDISFANIRLDIRHPKDLGMAGVPIHPCIRSDKTFSRARELLTTCLGEHEKCKKTGLAPSRLLDVTLGRTRLVNTKFMKDPVWAALSYCWGGPQHSQTTYLNLHDRYRQILLEDLPLTLRDAVYVCRQMEIQYLWIDSLCIIQEEKNNDVQKRESDKDRELRKMAGIFSGAVLTIAASCASSADEGFLQDRQQYEPAIGIPVCINGIYDMAQLVLPRQDIDDALEPEPIDSRAWTFQEQLLSSRMLSFTKHTMQWHYQSRDYNISQDELHFLSSSADYLVAYNEGTWVELVQEYCHRDLSNLEDRPIAIAAVAETFATNTTNFTTSDYVAGLWKTNILEELLWFPSRKDPKPDNLPKLQGPSWSWTSIPEMISYGRGVKFEPKASLISIDVDLADPHFVFGAVKSGKLRLRGIISRHHTERMLPPLPDWTYRDDGCPRLHVDRHKTPMEVFLLELGIRHGLTRMLTRSVGLALQSTGKLDQFVRIGIYTEDIYKHSRGCCIACQEIGTREERAVEII